MNKKKVNIIAITLIISIIFGTIQPILSHAIYGPTITVSDVVGYAGDTVEVPIIMSNNPGVVAVMLQLTYDSEMMTLIEVTDGGILGTALHSDTFTDPYCLFWANFTSTKDYTDNGVIAILKFKLLEDIGDVDIQTCPLTLSYNYDDYDIINCDMEAVRFNIENGTVTIKEKPKLVDSVSLDKTSLNMTSGDTATLTASISPSNATNKNITWRSSNRNVVTVENGVVTAIAKGNATITVITEDGGKTATCAVSVVCAHTNTVHYAKIEPTCTTMGHEAYIFCNQCKEVIAGQDMELSFLPHALTPHNRVEPTHTTYGNIEYWTCEECGKFFSDAFGKNEIKKTDTILNKYVDEHDYTVEWSTDTTTHWKDCPCGILLFVGQHEYDNLCDKSCNLCGRERIIEHTWNSSYSQSEDAHWIECSVCHVEKSGTRQNHDFTRELAEDKYLIQNATCTSGAVYHKCCTTCGQAGMDKFYGRDKDFNNHTGEIEWTYDNEYKKGTCEGCLQEFLIKTPNLKIEARQGQVNDEVYVTFAVEKGITANTLSISELEYDENKLQLIGGKWSVSGAIESTFNDGEGAITFEDNTEIKGTFFTLTFKILDEVSDEVTVTCKIEGVEKQADGAETNIEFVGAKDHKAIPIIKQQIIVGSGIGYTGKRISVPITLENNPGIVGMLLSVSYDNTVLNLISVTDGEKLGGTLHSNVMDAQPYTLCWFNGIAKEDFTYNGQVVVLTFEVLENAKLGKTEISIFYDYDDCDIINFALEPVSFAIVNGVYDISEVLVGDVNDDDMVTTDDAIYLLNHITQPSLYPVKQKVDFDGNGSVTSDDAIYLLYHVMMPSSYPID